MNSSGIHTRETRMPHMYNNQNACVMELECQLELGQTLVVNRRQIQVTCPCEKGVSLGV